MKIYDIDELPELKKVLGKARTDRIRYHLHGTGRRQPAATNIVNTLQETLVDLHRIPSEIEDALSGAAAIYGSSDIPLSVSRLWNMLQIMTIFNTREIQRATRLGESQARRYMQAIKMVLPIIYRYLEKFPVVRDDCYFEDDFHFEGDEIPDLSCFSDIADAA